MRSQLLFRSFIGFLVLGGPGMGCAGAPHPRTPVAANPDACSPGSAQAGARPPDGYQTYCEAKLSDGSLENVGPFARWFPNGKKALNGSFVHGKRDGVWDTWDKEGHLVIESHYTTNQLNGDVSEFSDTGRKLKQIHFQQGIKEGLARSWYPDGTIQAETAFHGDQMHGKETLWHPNGKKKREANWANGLAQGTVREWSEDGVLVLEEERKDSKLNGRYTRWDGEHQKIAEAWFKNGKPVSRASIKIN